ncbi:MAG: nucleotide pyrophosphohydrolase [Nitrososphaerota archaeon]
MHNDNVTTINELKVLVENFVKARKWEKFHTPRNLAESICIEAAELLEIFQWNLENESINDPITLDKIKEELADVLIYCISMANNVKIDIATSIVDKIRKNEEKYPLERSDEFFKR